MHPIRPSVPPGKPPPAARGVNLVHGLIVHGRLRHGGDAAGSCAVMVGEAIASPANVAGSVNSVLAATEQGLAIYPAGHRIGPPSTLLLRHDLEAGGRVAEGRLCLPPGDQAGGRAVSSVRRRPSRAWCICARDVSAAQAMAVTAACLLATAARMTALNSSSSAAFTRSRWPRASRICCRRSSPSVDAGTPAGAVGIERIPPHVLLQLHPARLQSLLTNPYQPGPAGVQGEAPDTGRSVRPART